jgi:hypothetical protein
MAETAPLGKGECDLSNGVVWREIRKLRKRKPGRGGAAFDRKRKRADGCRLQLPAGINTLKLPGICILTVPFIQYRTVPKNKRIW